MTSNQTSPKERRPSWVLANLLTFHVTFLLENRRCMMLLFFPSRPLIKSRQLLLLVQRAIPQYSSYLLSPRPIPPSSDNVWVGGTAPLAPCPWRRPTHVLAWLGMCHVVIDAWVGQDPGPRRAYSDQGVGSARCGGADAAGAWWCGLGLCADRSNGAEDNGKDRL